MDCEQGASPPPRQATIMSISAVTLTPDDMSRAVRFYRALGFTIHHGGEDSSFTSFHAGRCHLNLVAQPRSRKWSWWGRIIFYVSDVDAMYERAIAQGLCPEAAPRDAEWGERYFHLIDPDRHELSFAKLLENWRNPCAPKARFVALGCICYTREHRPCRQ